MESLLYFLLFGGLFLMMMRFGCGAHTMGHGHGHGDTRGERPGSYGNPRWVPPAKDNDPVCGMTVETAKAKSVVHDGAVYYFCSAACRDKFEAAPGAYLKAPGASPQQQEHRHDSHH
jgi:YHS domain-containing protein